MKQTKVLLMAAMAILAASCGTDIVKDNVKFAEQQMPALAAACEKEDGSIAFPHYINPDGTVLLEGPRSWISGFEPGNLWYMYELTGDKKWAELATKHTEALSEVQYFSGHHDIGFMIGSSYGNGLRLLGTEGYDQVLINAAKSLCTRFRPAAGVTQSWNADRGWQKEKGWMCPVIIDNMMNLELLFKASELSGDDTYRNIAISHANTTMANHFREDYSTWHVVDYDPETGEVRGKYTAQGFSDDSAWARGQSWGLYGYTMCYRFTKDEKYLAQAEHIANFILSNPNMPEDLVPYWDYNAPNIPDEPRDASSAAILASALYELYTYTNNTEYLAKADKVIESLSSPAYRSPLGENHGFLLMHSVSSLPHGRGINTTMVYADYYFLEALVRKSKLQK